MSVKTQFRVLKWGLSAIPALGGWAFIGPIYYRLAGLLFAVAALVWWFFHHMEKSVDTGYFDDNDFWGGILFVAILFGLGMFIEPSDVPYCDKYRC